MGLAIILLIPLYFSSATIFPFVVLKAALVHFGIALVVFGAIFHQLKSAGPLRISALGVSLLIFLLISLISSYLGLSFEQSFFSTFERSQGLYSLFFSAALGLSLATTHTNEDIWRNSYRAIVITGSIIALLALGYFVGLFDVQYLYRDFGRLAFTAGNAAVFGNYLAILTTLAFALCLADYRTVSMRVSLLQLGMLGLLLFALLATGARGGLLAFLVSAVVILFGSALPKKWKLIATAAGSLILLVGIVALWDIVGTRLAESTLNNQSIAYRLDAWQIGWQATMERPWLGWGQENFIHVFGQFSSATQIANETFDAAHNHLIALGVASGAVGLLSYVTIVTIALAVLWRGLQSTSPLRSGNALLGLSIILSYQIAAVFLFDNIISQPFFFIALGYCLHLSTPITVLPSKLKPAIAGIAVLLFVATAVHEIRLYQSSIRLRTVEAVPDWTSKLIAANEESGGLRQEELIYLFAMKTSAEWRSLSPGHKQEVKQTLEKLIGDSNILRLNWRTIFNVSNAYLMMVNDYPEVVKNLELLVARTSQLAPERPQSHRLLAHYFIVTNQPERAKQVLEDYLNKNPKRPRMLEILDRLTPNDAS
tara:strand:- start:30015 stop:31805 length:1791 start_codon:yes stop_codon:yes gene_type:complete